VSPFPSFTPSSSTFLIFSPFCSLPTLKYPFPACDVLPPLPSGCARSLCFCFSRLAFILLDLASQIVAAAWTFPTIIYIFSKMRTRVPFRFQVDHFLVVYPRIIRCPGVQKKVARWWYMFRQVRPLLVHRPAGDMLLKEFQIQEELAWS
jgi:hypothetical protein